MCSQAQQKDKLSCPYDQSIIDRAAVPEKFKEQFMLTWLQSLQVKFEMPCELRHHVYLVLI